MASIAVRLLALEAQIKDLTKRLASLEAKKTPPQKPPKKK